MFPHFNYKTLIETGSKWGSLCWWGGVVKRGTVMLNKAKDISIFIKKTSGNVVKLWTKNCTVSASSQKASSTSPPQGLARHAPVGFLFYLVHLIFEQKQWRYISCQGNYCMENRPQQGKGGSRRSKQASECTVGRIMRRMTMHSVVLHRANYFNLPGLWCGFE